VPIRRKDVSLYVRWRRGYAKKDTGMFSLQQLLGRDEKFFDLLEASAEQACRSVEALVALLKTPDRGRSSLDEFIQTRRKDKRITEDISAALCKTFVTPLEREDIEALSVALYKIPKTVEKFGERLLLCQEKLGGEDFSNQTRMIEQETGTILMMIKSLRDNPKLENVKDQNERLQFVEGEADKLMVDLLRDLYSGKHDPLRVVILRDLYELLEKVIDRCRDAGNIIFRIVLKNS
jgi:uncharacterized protein Yka (UPF0111/DUF47 family)